MWKFIKDVFYFFGLIIKGIAHVFIETKKEIDKYNESFYVKDSLVNVLDTLVNTGGWKYIPANEFDRVYALDCDLFNVFDNVYFNYKQGCFCLKSKDNDWCILVCYGSYDAKFVADLMKRYTRYKDRDYSSMSLFNDRLLIDSEITKINILKESSLTQEEIDRVINRKNSNR